ncbi:MAG: CUAEP/CCAEP-tail radical SAM (seleno)protein, partial [Candidatus Rokuibacteriota bacterium]
SVPMHTALRLGVQVAEHIRAVNRDSHLAFYGLYATLNADYLREHGVDSVLSGEVEQALVELADALEGDHSKPLAPQPRLQKLTFPAPSRRLLPGLKKYARLEHAGRQELAGYVEASRGCRHLCAHCPIPPIYGGRFFVVPRAVVLADVRQLVEAGAAHISFGDPDFLNGPRHAFAIAEDLHAEFPHLTFDVTAKIEHLLRHRQRLPELARAGCLFVVSAVESLSDPVLGHLAKGHTRADVFEALRAVRGSGMTLRPTWVPFTPWTTLDDYQEMLDFVERESLVDAVDPVQYSIRLLVPPGSLLVTSAALRPYLGPLVARDFYYEWTHADPAMDALQRAVATLVEDAAGRGEDPAVTFGSIRRAAEAAAGLPSGPPLRLPPGRPRAPRLSEPWFC